MTLKMSNEQALILYRQLSLRWVAAIPISPILYNPPMYAAPPVEHMLYPLG